MGKEKITALFKTPAFDSFSQDKVFIQVGNDDKGIATSQP